jgi:DNA repair protein RecO (recombination protein O)
MQLRSHAIILKRVAYGDADWIVTFFCRDRGRMSGMAKSARTSKRRFSGSLEPGSIVDLRFVERSTATLVRLEEAQVAVPMNGALKSLKRIEALMRALALALSFLQEHEPNPLKFDLLCDRLVRLNDSDPEPFETAAFELEWLARSGFAPVLERCVCCGNGVCGDIGRWVFDFDRGGLVCSLCFAHTTKSHALTKQELEGLGALLFVAPLSSEACYKAAGDVIGQYIDHILGRPLGTAVIEIPDSKHQITNKFQ